MHSNNEERSEKLSNEIIESPNINQEDDTDEKFPEAASDTDLVENEPDETASEHDPCQPCEENKPEEVPGDRENDPKKAGGKRKLQIQGKWKGVDPVVFFKDEATINSIKTFYGVGDSLVLNGQLVTRNSDSKHVKRIYYISKSVKDVLELNLLVGQQLKITSVGLKMFVSISIFEFDLLSNALLQYFSEGTWSLWFYFFCLFFVLFCLFRLFFFFFFLVCVFLGPALFHHIPYLKAGIICRIIIHLSIYGHEQICDPT